MGGNVVDFKLGHVLLQVDHMESAIDHFSSMGFIMVPGGLPGKYHNAMIYLKDGSFLELFSTEYGAIATWMMQGLLKLMGVWNRPYANRLALYLPGNYGLRDYALATSSDQHFKENIKILHKNGLLLSKIYKKKRIDMQGIKLTWELCAPYTTALPFLMSEYHPAQLLEDEDQNHPNGVVGIKEIHCRTNQWENVYSEYGRLLGSKPSIHKDGGRRSCHFLIQQTTIHLIEHEKNDLYQLVLYHEDTTCEMFEKLPAYLMMDTSSFASSSFSFSKKEG